MACTVFAILVVSILGTIHCKPLDKSELIGGISEAAVESSEPHSIVKRFINPSFDSYGGFAGAGLSKMRTKRSYDEECEKLALCKLHARSSRNFISAFELYFVNKENAKLWDHRSRSLADCHRRFGDCYNK